MAKMIDVRPSYKGEGKVWDSLNEYLPDDMVVYNQREINGREYDFCVMAEDLGIVIIEVKGWLSDKVIVNGVDDIVVEGYDKPQTSPKKQARAYRFAILNRINEKYNVSPLVMDMVCYPFISKQEYYASNLNLISEPEYTIFKEELENSEALNNKLMNVFQTNSAIPHSDFSYELMFRIRRNLEPNIREIVNDNFVLPYSEVFIIPKEIDEVVLQEITNHYFCGVKCIVFIKSTNGYEKILQHLNNPRMKN